MKNLILVIGLLVLNASHSQCVQAECGLPPNPWVCDVNTEIHFIRESSACVQLWSFDREQAIQELGTPTDESASEYCAPEEALRKSEYSLSLDFGSSDCSNGLVRAIVSAQYECVLKFEENG